MSELEKLFGLGGRVAVVAGASSGLGIECARAFAKAGAKVGLIARRTDRLEAVARELEKFGVQTCVAPADLTESDQIPAAYDIVEAALGPIDIVLNSAGIAELSRAEKHARDKWDRVVAINLTAAFELSQQIARRWIERGRGGRIIHVSSVMGSSGNAVHKAVSYTVTKSGLDGLVRHLAVEWAQHGIAVNAIAPAYFPTEMTIDPRYDDVHPDQVATMRRFTPMDRLGRDGELETAVLFLAAPATTYVTGSIVAVDGGWTAW